MSFRRFASRMFALTLVSCALALAGCDAPKLPKPWRIEYARVLGMRSEVINDEQRATPEPGERVRVRVLVVGPEPITRLSYALLVCPSLPPTGELPGCASDPFVADEGVLTQDDESRRVDRQLVLELEVPEEAELHGAEQLLVTGIVCAEGEARIGTVREPLGRCVGSDIEAVAWVDHIRIARDEEDYNNNPDLDAEAISLDDEVWLAGELGDELQPLDASIEGDDDAGDEPGADAGSADAGALPSLPRDGEEHTIRIDLEHSGRETSMAAMTSTPLREELLLSHFVTAGVLERRFSVLERNDPDDKALTVKWHSPPPEASPPPPRMVAAFVLRDQRGGVAFALRTLDLEGP